MKTLLDMNSSQESKSYRAYLTPVQISSPPLSPPPTSPLPLPPSALKKGQNNDAPMAVRDLRSRTSLPNLEYRRSQSMDTKMSPDCRGFTAARPDLPCNLVSSALKSSSENDLAGMKQTQRLSIARNSTEFSDRNTSVSRATKSLSHPSVQSSGNSIWSTLPQRQVERPETSETIRKSNRSNKPPRKAIARSPLYIPAARNPTQCTEHQSSNGDAITILLGDRITSLPRCPSGDDLARFVQQEQLAAPVKKQWFRNIESCVVYEEQNAASPTRPTGSVRRKLSKARIGHPDMINQNLKSVSVPARTSKRGPIVPVSKNNHAEKRTLAPIVNEEVANREESSASNGLGNEVQHQRWYVRRQRLVWILLTVAFILLGTGAVLGGVLWKLSRR